jgi:flavin-dependent dehydrogenase
VIDVLVAGGGPTGLAAAIRCVMAGLSVAVAEPRPGPVDKACGEGLMPAAVRRLAEIGVHPDGRPLRGILYLDPAHRAEALFRGPGGLGVRRTTLHAALAARAAGLGIPVLPARVTRFVQDRGGVTAALRDSAAAARGGASAAPGGEARAGAAEAQVRARYLVAADGLHSAIRRQCGLDPPSPRHPRFGLRRHYATVPWTGLVEVHWAPEAEAYVTPVSDGLVGVAVLCARDTGRRDDHDDGWRGGFTDRLAVFPALRERLNGAAAVTDVRGAGPLRQDVPRRTAGRVLLAGDASGYTDALTGEGIGAALAQAEVLAACLAAGRPEGYERAWRLATRKSRLLTSGLLWSRQRPLLAPRIVPAAQRLPRVFTAIVNEVAHA